MYWIATETSLRSPSSVISPGVAATLSSAAASGVDVLAQDLELVGALAERAVEDLERDRHEVGVGDPRAVVALRGLALLVLPDLRERDRVDLGVAPRGDERGHAADRVRAAAVAGRHQELGVGAHERHAHADGVAVREHELRAVAELLDHAEEVVPAPRVQPRRVRPELVEDLVHLEGGEDRLDQHGRADRSRARAPARPGRARTRGSTGAPPGATRAWADRSRGRSRSRQARSWLRSR